MSKRTFTPKSVVIERYRTSQVQKKDRGALASAPKSPTEPHTQINKLKATKDALYLAIFLLVTSVLMNITLWYLIVKMRDNIIMQLN